MNFSHIKEAVKWTIILAVISLALRKAFVLLHKPIDLPRQHWGQKEQRPIEMNGKQSQVWR